MRNCAQLRIKSLKAKHTHHSVQNLLLYLMVSIFVLFLKDNSEYSAKDAQIGTNNLNIPNYCNQRNTQWIL